MPSAGTGGRRTRRRHPPAPLPHHRRLRRRRVPNRPRLRLSPPAVHSGRRRNGRARHPRGNRRCHRDVHQPRRAAQELAAEALPRRQGSRWSSSRPRRPTQPLPFSLRVDDAVTRTLNGALYAVRGSAPSASRVEPPRRSALRVPRHRRPARGEGISGSSPRRTCSASAPTVHQGDVRWPPAIEWGPALGKEPSATEQLRSSARGDRFDRRRCRADSPRRRRRRAADASRRLSVRRRSTTTTSSRWRSSPGSSTVTFQPVTDSAASRRGAGRAR